MASDGKQIAAGFSAVRRKEVRPQTKYQVIYMNRGRYPVSIMCRFFEVSRSGYYDFVRRLGREEKDAALAEIIREKQERSFKTYGKIRVRIIA